MAGFGDAFSITDLHCPHLHSFTFFMGSSRLGKVHERYHLVSSVLFACLPPTEIKKGIKNNLSIRIISLCPFSPMTAKF